VPRSYPPEFRRKVLDLLKAGRKVADLVRDLQISDQTIYTWRRQAQVDAGARPGVTSDESAELRRLRRENAELRRANEILKAASAFFAAELDRPTARS
jgi:transposase-like protein